MNLYLYFSFSFEAASSKNSNQVVLSVNNLFETLVNQMGYVHNRTDDNLKGIFLLKIKSPNGDEGLKNLGKGKKVIDHIYNVFSLIMFI